MPDQPQGSIPGQGTLPGMTPDQLVNQQAAKQQELQSQGQAKQDAIQKAADKAARDIFKKAQNKTLRRGSLANFQYNFYKHDFAPLCLVGKIWPDGMISGLNLHYLTFRYIKYLLSMFCGKDFHYGLIKSNKYIVNAYRSYKREGRRNLKLVDCQFLNDTLSKARSFKPGELEAMRKEVQRQLREKLHPNAEEFAQQWQDALYKQSHKEYGIPQQQPDARTNPTNVTPPAPPTNAGQPDQI